MFSNYPSYLREIKEAYQKAPHNTKVKFNRFTTAVVITTMVCGTGCVTFDIAKAETQKKEAISALSKVSFVKDDLNVQTSDMSLSELIASSTQTLIVEDDIKEVLSNELLNTIGHLNSNNSRITIIDSKTTQIDIFVPSGATVTVIVEKDETGKTNVKDISANISSEKNSTVTEVIENIEETKKQQESTTQENHSLTLTEYNESDVLALLGWKADEHADDDDDALLKAVKEFLDKHTIVLDNDIMMLIPSGFELQVEEEAVPPVIEAPEENLPPVEEGAPLPEEQLPVEEQPQEVVPPAEEAAPEVPADSPAPEVIEVEAPVEADASEKTEADNQSDNSVNENAEDTDSKDSELSDDVVSSSTDSADADVDEVVKQTRTAQALNYKNANGALLTVRIEPLDSSTLTSSPSLLAQQLMDTWNKTTESIGVSANQTLKNPDVGFQGSIFYDTNSELWGYKSSGVMTDGSRDITRMRVAFVDVESNNIITVSYRNDTPIPAEGEEVDASKVSMTMDDFWKLFVSAPQKDDSVYESFTTKLDNLFIPVE